MKVIKIKELAWCIKCDTPLRVYWLKDGICNACRNPHLIVKAVVNKQIGNDMPNDSVEFKKAHKHIHQAIESLVPALEILRDSPIKEIDGKVGLWVKDVESVEHASLMLSIAIKHLHKVLK